MNGLVCYEAAQVGVEVGTRELEAHLDGSKSGGFVCVKGYENAHGEVSDYYIQFGINYGALKAKDISRLDKIIAGEENLVLTVKYGAWLDADGIAHNRKAKDRTHTTVTLSNLTMQDERLANAVREVRESLVHPKEVTTHYDKQAKGLYENESDGALHIRDSLLVSKQVRIDGNYPPSASSQDVAIRDALKRKLGTGRYRQFKFEAGKFESITISGQAILVDDDEAFYFALPETIKEVALETANA